jgi:hypothetical protein
MSTDLIFFILRSGVHLIDLILGILGTLICGFGMGTLYFITFLIWYMVIYLLLKWKFGEDFKFEVVLDKDAENIQKEKTQK